MINCNNCTLLSHFIPSSYKHLYYQAGFSCSTTNQIEIPSLHTSSVRCPDGHCCWNAGVFPRKILYLHWYFSINSNTRLMKFAFLKLDYLGQNELHIQHQEQHVSLDSRTESSREWKRDVYHPSLEWHCWNALFKFIVTIQVTKFWHREHFFIT